MSPVFLLGIKYSVYFQAQYQKVSELKPCWYRNLEIPEPGQTSNAFHEAVDGFY